MTISPQRIIRLGIAAANRLLCENRSDDGGLETFYTYDANGNLLTHIAASADGIAGSTGVGT